MEIFQPRQNSANNKTCFNTIAYDKRNFCHNFFDNLNPYELGILKSEFNNKNVYTSIAFVFIRRSMMKVANGRNCSDFL